MKFNSEITEYLTDKKFSPALDVSFGNEKYPETPRKDLLIQIVRGKNVIHFGCADHLPLIEQKRRNGNWLHGLLTQQCQQCVGIDINEEAVQYIRTKIGIDNVFLPGSEVDGIIFSKQAKWDYMILGELIEHVDNPVKFLAGLQKKYGHCTKKLIITAPNVYNLMTIKDIRNNNENINTDHNYWFSPYTLTRVALKAGFKNPELYFADRVKLPLFMTVVKRLKQLLGITPDFKANCFNSIVLITDF